MGRRAGFPGPAIFVFCAMALFASPAHATSVPTSDHLSIDITATLIERCGLAAGSNGTSAEGRLDRSETLTFEFNIDCNTPFRIGVSSGNGALRMVGTRNVTGDVDAGGFAIAKPYRVGLQVQTDEGPLDGGTCRSDQLTAAEASCAFYGASAGHGLSSRGATAIGRTGTLTVHWQGQDNSGPRAAAGLYQDTLIVVVGPRT